jgi:hypothetical protein
LSDFLDQVRELVRIGEVRISEHGYDELAEDGLFVRDLLAGAADAVLVEEYPNYRKGPCVLVLQEDYLGDPVHVVWGIPRGHAKPVVLVTVYRPDPLRWSDDYLRRR